MFTDTSDLSRSVQQARNAAMKNVLSKHGASEKGDNIQKSYSDMRKSQDSYSKTNQKTVSVGSEKRLDSGQWTQKYVKDSDHRNFMQSLDPNERKILLNDLKNGGYLTGKTGRER